MTPSSPNKRVRLDQILVDRGLAESRTKAQALILAGQVCVDDQRVDKPGTNIKNDANITIKNQERFVSRGGYKLEGALDTLGLDPAARVCVDVGASTGGFTDCLLQRGASRVYAVDVGFGQLATKLVNDARVLVMDRTNARDLRPEQFPEPIDWMVVDASFIGIGKLASALYSVLRAGGTLLAMIKPQFEVGREQARKFRGVIKDEEVRAQAIDEAIAALVTVGFIVKAGSDSALAGPKGNLEYFVYATKGTD
jgi:23S rRNA (cytidine1920-2'-O)/16S rRNA (cytidine1409-2'-O)-methyltransferase